MSPRKEFSRRTKLDTWERAGGCCEDCGRKLYPGDSPEYDHRVTCEQGGDNSPENCVLLCKGCHSLKTKVDAKVAAKSRSVRAGHIGAKKARNPMPFGRHDRLKKKLNGQVVPR